MRSNYYWSFVVCVFILFVGKFVVAQQEFEAGGVWYNPITDTSVAVTHPPQHIIQLKTLQYRRP